MTKVMTFQVGDDGVLSVEVPLDARDANKLVRVTVETIDEPVTDVSPMDRDAWLRFIERTAGSIADPTFQRHPQGDYEEREPLS